MITLNARLILTMIAVFVLTIIPLPVFIAAARPAWVLLFVLYVQCYLPRYFRVTWVFLFGLCLDVLSSTLMGEHAFVLLLTTWIMMHFTRRFNFFSTMQQMLLILLFCLFYQFVIFLMDAYLGYPQNMLYVAVSALTTTLVWPWLKLLLTQRQTRLSHYMK